MLVYLSEEERKQEEGEPQEQAAGFRFEVSEESIPNEGVLNPPKTFLLYPCGLRWEGADQGTTQSFREELYVELKKFLQDYYEGDLDRFWGSVEAEAGRTLPSGAPGAWSSSIENVLSKGGESVGSLGSGKRGSGGAFEEIGALGGLEEEGRAIPGGRYGCA